MLAFDQARDNGDVPEGAFQQARLFDPFDKFMIQNVGGKQALRVRHGFQPIDGERVIIGYETQRHQTLRIHAASEQHAERLVRIPPLKTVADQIMPPLMREGFDQQLSRLRQG